MIVVLRNGARVVGSTVLDAEDVITVLLSSHGIAIGTLTCDETDKMPTRTAEEAGTAGLLGLATAADEL